MKAIILMGPAGSGKSTFRQRDWPDALVCSADEYHMADGVYVYDPKNARKAHAWCLSNFEDATRNKVPLVAVDNTNTTLAQVAPYVALALARDYEVELYALDIDPEYSHSRTIHGVPLKTVFQMWFDLKQTLRDWPPYWPHPKTIGIPKPLPTETP